MNLNILTTLLLVVSLVNYSQAEILPGRGSKRDVCQFPDGVKGRCEEIMSCMKTDGVVLRNNTIQKCDTDGRNTLVCCKHPYNTAAELCKAWKSYWTENKGQCVYSEPLIVGGEKAGIGEFPHIASLGFVNKRRKNAITWQCGGVLVSPHYVVTAAHCVLHIKSYVVKMGKHNTFSANLNNNSRIVGPVPNGLYKEKEVRLEKRNFAPVEQTIRVAKVILHPEYDLRYNDIALLLLEKPVVLTKRALPACLPINKTEDFLGQKVNVAGWGTTKPAHHAPANELQKVEVPIVRGLQCWESLSAVQGSIRKGITSEQICAGSDGKDSCQGDSGGPMVLQVNGSCEHTLAGIVSFGFGCGSYGVYTRVSSYVDWITDYIAPTLVSTIV